MIDKISTSVILCFLTLAGLSPRLWGQAMLEASEISSGGGIVQGKNYTAVGILGQPISSGLAGGTQFLLSGGLIPTLEEDVKAPVIAHAPVTFHPLEQDLVITASISGTGNLSSVTLNYRKGGETTFRSTPMIFDGRTYQATVPGGEVTTRGLEYYLQASNILNNVTRLPNPGFYSIQITFAGEGVLNDTVQPTGGDQSAYRLISIPIDADDKSPAAYLEDDLGPYDRSKWRFFGLLEEPQSEKGFKYIEYFEIAGIFPGQAFWLIVKDVQETIDSGPGKTNRTSQPFEIPLNNGWTLIANPFNFPIPLSNLTVNGRQSPVLRTFNGEWNDPINSPVTRIDPFEGYAVKVTGSGNTLAVNPDLSNTIGFGKLAAIPESPDFQWGIHIVARCNQAVDADNYAAVRTGANSGWDEDDLPEPPSIGKHLSLYFPHSDWGAYSDRYCIDMRSQFTSGEVWEFSVTSNMESPVYLTFAGMAKTPEAYEIWLVDELLKTVQDLRSTDQYLVNHTSTERPRAFKLVVGDSRFVESRFMEYQVRPATYELFQNFPNPFNPATTIRFGIPEAERVTLKIFNVLGQEVVTLLNSETRNAGYHVVSWDGRNRRGEKVSSGIYLYHIQAGNFSRARKLMLLK